MLISLSLSLDAPIDALLWLVCPAGARDLVKAMLQRDPAQRPTAAQLLQHPWLTGKVNSTIRPVSPMASAADITAAAAGAAAAAAAAAAAPEAVAAAAVAAAPAERPLDDSLVQRLQRYGTWGRLKQVSKGRGGAGGCRVSVIAAVQHCCATPVVCIQMQ